MNKSKRPVIFMLIASALILILFLIMQPVQIYRFSKYIAVLFPKGIIGTEELHLLLIIQLLMLIIVVPVFILTFVFSWKYRADNRKAKYDPDLVDNLYAEVVWWGAPLILTIVVAVLTWQKTYELDPFKSIPSQKKEMTIQVVALQWKWLFIYPEEGIASLNFLQIPVGTPVRFEITSDAPMNSFWIPSLGGQIYAMPKMRTILNLIANKTGDFRGSSANLSGEGFAGMHFITRASTEEEFKDWIAEAKKAANQLDSEVYTKLAAPSQNNPTALYQLKEKELFDQIIDKYMLPKAKE